MIRAILAFSAALVCGAIGILLALRLEKRTRRLCAWRTAMIRLSGALSYAAFSLPAALSYAAHPDVQALNALREKLEEDPAQTPEMAFQTLPKEETLKEEDVQAILLGIRALEGATVKEQCAGLALCISALDRLEDAARSASEKNARLLLSGGILSGAALLIILL